MALNKKLFNTAGEDTITPSQHFQTFKYKGNGGTQKVGSHINTGLEFNGTSTRVDTSGLNSFFGKKQTFSVSAWVNCTASGNRAIFDDYNGANQNIALYVYDGTINFFMRYNNTDVTGLNTGSTTYYFDFHHVVATSDQTTAKLYVDGSLVASASVTSQSYSGGSPEVGIGRQQHPSSSTYAYFNGVIDQVRVFSKAISSTEVTTLYNETYSSTSKSVTDIFGDRSALALYQFENSVNDTGGASGYYGAGAIFDGSSSAITLPTGSFSYTDFSITAWIKQTAQDTSDIILENYDYQSSTSRGFIFRVNSGYLRFDGYYSDANVTTATSSSSISLDTWTHVACVFNTSESGADRIKLFINGSETSYSSRSFDSIQYHSTAPTSIGRLSSSVSGSGEQYYTGHIDELRVYDDALTSTELGYIYNNTTASIPTDNLQAYYKFEDNAQDEQQNFDGVSSNVIYRFDGSGNDISFQGSTNFRPDFTWTKMLGSNNHQLFDSVRGVTKELESNTTAVEVTNSNSLTVFNSNGFTVGSSNNENQSGTEYISWNWRAGGAPTATNTNSSGAMTANSVSLNGTLQSSYTPSGSPSIYPTKMSINTTSGFSIITWTGTQSNDSISHGLTAAPNLIIVKDTSNAYNWYVFTKPTGAANNLRLEGLNTTNAATTQNSQFTTTDSLIENLSTSVSLNTSSATMLAYCFHDVANFQKIGTFVGNDSTNGVIVETGFEVGWLLLKNTTTSGNSWAIIDNIRSSANPRLDVLFPNSSDTTYTSTGGVNFLTNGFQVVSTDNFLNGSGDTMLYWAIAADPSTAATPTVEKSFDVVIYDGNGSTQDIESDISPDFVWVKRTSSSEDNVLFDTVRGVQEQLRTNSQGTQSTKTNALSSFNKKGFTTGANNALNTNGQTYQALLWSAGSHEGNLPTANEQGSISSVTSVNDASGFSIVKYTGNGSAGATVGHGLSAPPTLIITKGTTGSAGVTNWNVYVSALGATKKLVLNSDAAESTNTTWWNDTAPTATVFSLGTTGDSNYNNSNYIAYCFTDITSYQKIGSYTGQTSGVTITTGFRPRLIIVKSTSNVENWVVLTTDLGSGNAVKANTDAANDESSRNTFTVSNTGFSFPHQSTADAALNENNYTYIYYAVK